MIDAVFFDCFGVLFDMDTDLGAQCPPENRAEMAGVFARSDHGYITRDEFIAEVARLVGCPAEHFRCVLEQAHVRNDALFATIHQLRRQHPALKIGLLSNVGDDTINRLFTEEDLALFDTCVLSHEEHITKPDPRLFAVAAERLAVPIGRCMMIDDRVENCDGAEAAGMSAIQYTTVADMERDFRAYNILLNRG